MQYDCFVVVAVIEYPLLIKRKQFRTVQSQSLFRTKGLMELSTELMDNNNHQSLSISYHLII